MPNIEYRGHVTLPVTNTMPNCYKCGKQLGSANWTGGPDKFWHRYGCPETVVADYYNRNR